MTMLVHSPFLLVESGTDFGLATLCERFARHAQTHDSAVEEERSEKIFPVAGKRRPREHFDAG
jgi:hypothetical protein